MTILLNNATRLLVQGITGRQASWSTQDMIDYGTNVVAGVVPGRGSQQVLDRPVFNSVRDAIDATGANTSIVFVGANMAAEAIAEAIDARVPLIVYPGDGLPVKDAISLKSQAKRCGVTLVGGNTPGVIAPGYAKVGFMPSHCYAPGRVGVITKSGSLSYESCTRLTLADIGQSTVLGIGGDPVKGVTTSDALALFHNDPDTDVVLILGEIGGVEEYAAVDYVAQPGAKKVAAFLVGRIAPQGRKLGHAGALIGSERETYAAKTRALCDSGIRVIESLSMLASDISALLNDN